MKNTFLWGDTTAEKLVKLQDAYESLIGTLFAQAEPKGDYTVDTVYKYGDMVMDNGSSYIYMNSTAAQGVPVANKEYWFMIASVGSPGQPGRQGETGETGARGNGIISAHSISHTTVDDEEVTTVELVTDDTPYPQFEVHAKNGTQGFPGEKGLTALEVAPMSFAGVPAVGTVIGVTGTMNRSPVAEDVATFILYDTVSNASYWCTVQFKNAEAQPYPLASVLSVQAATASGDGGSSKKLYQHLLKVKQTNKNVSLILLFNSTNNNNITSYDEFYNSFDYAEIEGYGTYLITIPVLCSYVNDVFAGETIEGFGRCTAKTGYVKSSNGLFRAAKVEILTESLGVAFSYGLNTDYTFSDTVTEVVYHG